MGFRNSPPYVQRQMDRILRRYRAFARAYVDDVTIFSKTLEEHLQHLNTIFKLFDQLRISLRGTKSFLGYPSTTVLGQLVDGFGLQTATEKLAALVKLKFPHSLKNLETYLGLTGWLRNYIPYYAKICEPLQRRKTMMLREAPIKGKAWQAHTKMALIDEPTEEE